MKNKQINPPMEFIPGGKRYQPQLPLRKTNQKLKIGINWKLLIMILVFLIVAGTIYFWLGAKI